ncbi:MAG: DUF3244 domain-containing protein [Bacteroidales bacterium]|nr:DUF3244 domain-containing protein [Bacteroidales bacterium]
MKTRRSIKVILLVAGLILSYSFQAKGAGNMIVHASVMSNKKVVLRISDAPKRALELNIENATTGELVYQKRLSKDTVYLKVFSLSNLPEGEYSLTIETEEKIYRKFLGITRDSCLLLGEAEDYKPIFDNENENLLITFRNSQDENLKVLFRNNLGIFFKDEPNQATWFRRKYNLSMLEPGSYQVDLLAGDDTYSYSFEIR